MEKPDGTTSYQKGNEERGPIKKGKHAHWTTVEPLFQVTGSSQGATSTHMRPSRHTDIIAQDFGGRVEPTAVQGNKKTETCAQTFQIEITSTNQLNLGMYYMGWCG